MAIRVSTLVSSRALSIPRGRLAGLKYAGARGGVLAPESAIVALAPRVGARGVEVGYALQSRLFDHGYSFSLAAEGTKHALAAQAHLGDGRAGLPEWPGSDSQATHPNYVRQTKYKKSMNPMNPSRRRQHWRRCLAASSLAWGFSIFYCPWGKAEAPNPFRGSRPGRASSPRMSASVEALAFQPRCISSRTGTPKPRAIFSAPGSRPRASASLPSDIYDLC